MKARSPLSRVCSLMEEYAKRGVFRGFTKQPERDGVVTFKLTWHRDRIFDVTVDTRKKSIVLPVLLANVPSRSALYKDFKAFLQAHHDATLPDHRRMDRGKAFLRCANRRGNVCVTVVVRDGDYEYGLMRLIHLIHETFVLFLVNGMYRDYLVEELGVDPDIG